jgi:hypothetical protein
MLAATFHPSPDNTMFGRGGAAQKPKKNGKMSDLFGLIDTPFGFLRRKVQVNLEFALILDLNKVTPKDEYPMPVAYMLINDVSKHKVISFLDGNAGYRQIIMAEEDNSKTTFRCPDFVGLFEWVIMTFGLKKYQCDFPNHQQYFLLITDNYDN